MPVSEMSDTGDGLPRRMVGVRWLLTREDLAGEGSRQIDPIPGANPLGILTTMPDRFAAEFMNRNRSGLGRLWSPQPGRTTPPPAAATMPALVPARSIGKQGTSSIAYRVPRLRMTWGWRPPGR